MKLQAKIYVSLKNGVLDPQGQAIENSLRQLGFAGVNEVTQGKFFQITLEAENQESGKLIVKDICDKLLVNNVIEKYEYEILEIA